MWALTAIFEFADGEAERQELYQGTREACNDLADRLERDTALGLNGIRYDGERKEPPVQAVIVVHAIEEQPG